MKRLVAAALLAATVLAGCNDSGKKPADTEGRFFLPGYLPPGMKIASGTIQVVGPGSTAFGAAIGKSGTQPDTYTDVILVQASAASADRSTGQFESVKPIDINGVAGRSHDDPLRGAYVDWFAHGIAIAVSGPAGALDIVSAVARKIVLPPDANIGAVALGELPPGYGTITAAHFEDRNPEAGETVQVGTMPGPTFRLVGLVTDAPLLIALGGGDTVRKTLVRGHPAYATYRSRDVGAGNGRVVEGVLGWEERPGIVLSVISNTDPERLREIAEGVRAVTEDQFRQTVSTTTTAKKKSKGT
jgi:hypothetical protein